MPMPLFTAGRRLRASELKALADQVDSLTAPGWQAYTVAWTAAGVAPALGNGTKSGRYRRSASGDLVKADFLFVWGSTTTNGTGIWNFSLPVPASAAAVGIGESGSGWILNASDIRYPINGYLSSSTTVALQAGAFANAATTINNRGGDVQNATPFTFATGDALAFTIEYEAA